MAGWPFCWTLTVTLLWSSVTAVLVATPTPDVRRSGAPGAAVGGVPPSPPPSLEGGGGSGCVCGNTPQYVSFLGIFGHAVAHTSALKAPREGPQKCLFSGLVGFLELVLGKSMVRKPRRHFFQWVSTQSRGPGGTLFGGRGTLFGYFLQIQNHPRKTHFDVISEVGTFSSHHLRLMLPQKNVWF